MSMITIVPEDNVVIVHGVGYKVDCSSLDPELHAIQWDHDNKEGWNEWKNAPNEKITEIRGLDAVFELWGKAKAEEEALIDSRKAKLADAEKVMIEAMSNKGK
jgi:hypothetical protein